jgi:hypothetical protein
MRIADVFWKLLSDEKKEELFNIIGEPVPDDDTALAVIRLPFGIANHPKDEMEDLMKGMFAPKSMPKLVYKIHEILYND